MPTYIIAAIDPGATTGIAIISLSGRKIETASTNEGMADAVRIIERHGTPSLIACDVTPAPEAAQKIASYFSCRLFEPGRNIREEEKRQISKGAGVENNHERDAYAAAVLAYRQHANKLRQIESLPGISHEDKERVSHLMLKGYKLKDAFLELKEPEPARLLEKEEDKESARPISAGELRERASSLARENANLRLLLGRMENERQQLEGSLRLFENGVRQSLLRDSELRRLRFQLQQTLGRLTIKPKHSGDPHKQAQMQKNQQQGQGQSKQAVRQPAGPLHQQKQQPSPAQNDDLNRLGKPQIDLEKMVTEYRRGKKQS